MDALRAIIEPYPHVRRLYEAPLRLGDDSTVVFGPASEVGGLNSAVARMLRQIPRFGFEIGEMPIVNYLSARDTGIALRAIPVFLTRRFVHGLVFVDSGGVQNVEDLDGRFVGCPYWGHSDATWCRGLLASRYGVDLDSITWVTDNEEQVPGAVLPDNVVHLPRSDFEQMLRTGELDALIMAHGRSLMTPSSPETVRLFPNSDARDRAWFAEEAMFPILHTVVIQERVLDGHPSLADELFQALCAARADAIDALISSPPSEEDAFAALKTGLPTPALAFLGEDPSPSGIEANRTTLERIVEMAAEQRVISRAAALEELFIDCEPEAAR